MKSRRKQDYHEYAFYKGDEFIGIYTIDEYAAIRGVSRRVCKRYTKEYYQNTYISKRPSNKLIGIRIDDDEE